MYYTFFLRHYWVRHAMMGVGVVRPELGWGGSVNKQIEAPTNRPTAQEIVYTTNR